MDDRLQTPRNLVEMESNFHATQTLSARPEQPLRLAHRGPLNKGLKRSCNTLKPRDWQPGPHNKTNKRTRAMRSGNAGVTDAPNCEQTLPPTDRLPTLKGPTA
jgi:hypothetical protein